MKRNDFRNCATAISDADLDAAEASLGFVLPAQFRQHYLTYNGGNPELSIFPGDDLNEPVEVAAFYPIKNNTPAFDTKNSLLVEHYRWMCGKDVIPSSLLPFGHDPGGNFICLNVPDGGVVFYATDSFDPDISMTENHAKVQRRLADSFEEFMDQLDLDEGYGDDEWPA